MQQAICDYNFRRFHDQLNGVLMDGWRVVPGTMYFGSAEVVACPDTPAVRIDRHGHTFDKCYFVVVEKEDAK